MTTQAQITALEATLAIAAAQAAELTPDPTSVALIIAAVPALTLVIGAPFSYQLSASGGVAPYEFSAVQDATHGLPPGLACTNSGLVGGKPEANPAADATDQNGVSFVVHDSAGNAAESPEVVWTLAKS